MNKQIQKQVSIVEVRKTVVSQIEKLGVDIPKDYSIDNAVQAAFMAIREVKDRNKRYAFDVCSPESIQRSIFSMCVQGLNPDKTQCYFIVRGSQLTIMRSYLGSIAVAKRVENWIKDVKAVAVYEDDVFDYEIVNGDKRVLRHKQSLVSTINKSIIGAYAMVVDKDDNVVSTEIMNITDIYRSWSKSSTNVFLPNGDIDPKSTHGQYPERMARRTVINRACKHIISTSSDEMLLKNAANSDPELTITEEININANQTEIDFDQPKEEVRNYSGAPLEIDFKEVDVSSDGDTDGNSEPDYISDKVYSGPIEAKADKEKCKEIFELNVTAGRKEKKDVLDDVAGFVGREISVLSDLTESEASMYIEHLKSPADDIPEPDWL